jgi:hypothetical protein
LISGVIQKSRKYINSQYLEPKACRIGHINFQVTALSPIKMMTVTNPTADPEGRIRSNPTNRATLEGGGSKVTSDPQGNPVSISMSSISFLSAFLEMFWVKASLPDEGICPTCFLSNQSASHWIDSWNHSK